VNNDAIQAQFCGCMDSNTYCMCFVSLFALELESSSWFVFLLCLAVLAMKADYTYLYV
jgi:hypothetical protein